MTYKENVEALINAIHLEAKYKNAKPKGYRKEIKQARGMQKRARKRIVENLIKEWHDLAKAEKIPSQ